MIWVHALKGSALDQLSKQSLTHADATPWHETLTLSSNENTNPFPKQTTPPHWTERGREKRVVLFCFSVSNAVEKTGAARQMISEIYLVLHFLWTSRPSGAITVWLIRAGVRRGETSDLRTRLNLQHNHGRGKDQPQSSSGHVPFLSLLVTAVPNYQKGVRSELPCSADLCDTKTDRHGAKLKANLQGIKSNLTH